MNCVLPPTYYLLYATTVLVITRLLIWLVLGVLVLRLFLLFSAIVSTRGYVTVYVVTSAMSIRIAIAIDVTAVIFTTTGLCTRSSCICVFAPGGTGDPQRRASRIKPRLGQRRLFKWPWSA